MNTFNKIGIFGSVIVISSLTLFPLNFLFDQREISWRVLTLSSTTGPLWDSVANALLYIPFGFAMSAYFSGQGMRRLKLFIFTLMMCFALSYATEVLQSFLPSRNPSWSDVGANIFGGGMLGYLCALVRETKSPSLALFGYFTAAGLVAMGMQRSTTFNNWNISFPLIVGNEHTGDRPWRGGVSEFYIARKGGTEYEMRRTLAEKTPVPIFAHDLLAYYKKNGSEEYRDELAK